MLRRLVGVIVLLGIIATAGPARAEPLGNPLKVLAGKNTATGKCTSLNGSPVNGAKLVTWSCDNGTDQRWHGDYRWVGGSYKMTLRDWTNKCVGLANRGSTANGTELVLWDCHYQSDQMSGGRRESHPPAPTDPGVNLSAHRALVILITRRWRAR